MLRFTAGLLATLFTLLLAAPAQAITYTWNQTTSGNWSTGFTPSPPVSATDAALEFGGSTNYTATNNIGAGTFQVNSIAISNTGTTTIAPAVAANTITFAGTTPALTIAVGSGAVSISNGLLYSVATAITNSSSSLLTLSGAQTLTTAPTFGGSGNISISGVMSGGTAGTTTFTKTGAGILTLTGVNTFLGNIALTGGTLNLGLTTTAGATGNTINIANGTTVQFTTANFTTTTTTHILSFAAAATATIEVGPGFTASLLGNHLVGTTATLNKIGGGTITLGSSGTSTLAQTSGSVNVNNGFLRFTSSRLGSMGNIVVADGASFYLFDTTSITAITIAATKTLTLNGNGNAAGNGNGSTVIKGAYIHTLDEVGSAASSFSMPIILASTSRFTLANGRAGADTITDTIATGISGVGGLILDGSSTSTLILSSAATYGGNTTIASGTLRMSGTADRLPTGTSLTIGGDATANVANTSGVFDLNGLGQTVAGLSTAGNGTTNRVITSAVGAPTFTVNLASGSQTFGGILGGAGANNNNFNFVKSGNGTLVLGSANTMTGTTTVSAGTLKVTPYTAASAFTIADGAALSVVESGPVAFTFSLPTLALGATGSTINFDLVTATAAVPIINVTTLDGLTTGGGAHTLNVSNTVNFTVPTTITLIDYTGTAITTGFTLGSMPPRTVASLTYNTINTSIDLSVTAVDTIKWNGGISADWDVGTGVGAGGTNNWKEIISGTITNFVTGDTVRFDDTAAGNFSVNLTTAVQPASIVISNTTEYTFSGVGSIAGTTGITKSGLGNVNLNTANTFTGTTTINLGTITLGDALALQSSTVQLNSSDGLVIGTPAAVTIGGLTGASNLALSVGKTLSVGNNNAATTYSGAFTGAGDLAKVGSGAFTLTGASTGTGAFTISAGSVAIGAGGTIGSIAFASTTVASGATLSINRSDAVTIGTPLSGAGNFTNTLGTTVITADYGITGVTSVAAGSLTVNRNTNFAFTGATTIAAGAAFTVNVGGAAAVSNAGGLAIAGTYTANVDTGATLTQSGLVTGGATAVYTKTGTGQVTLTSASTGFTGTLNINGGTFLLSDPGAGTGGSSGDLNAVAVNVNNGGTFQFGVGGVAGENPDLPNSSYVTVNVGGSVIWKIGETMGGVNLSGGTITLSGGSIDTAGTTPASNSFTSGTINGTANSLGGTAAINKTTPGTVLVSGSAFFVTSVLNIQEGTIAFATAANLGTTAVNLGTIAPTTGRFEYQGITASRAGAFTLIGGGEIKVTGATAALTLTGAASGAGDLNKTGAGALILTGVNTHTGAITVTAGTLGGTTTLGSATAALTVATGGTLRAGAATGAGTLTVTDRPVAFTLGSILGVRITDASTPFDGVNPGSSSLGTLPNPTSNNFLNIIGTGTLAFDAGTTIAIDGNGTTFTPSTIYSYAVGQAPSAGAVTGLGTPITAPVQFSTLGFSADPASYNLSTTNGIVYLGFTTAAVPEPGMIFGLAALALGGVRKLRRKKCD